MNKYDLCRVLWLGYGKHDQWPVLCYPLRFDADGRPYAYRLLGELTVEQASYFNTENY